jgi:hypothetical protein
MNYESYLSKCHPVYIDRPDSFFSGQELEPEMYKPVIAKFPKAESMSLSVPSEIEIKNVVANCEQEVDLVPHVFVTGLGIGTSRSKYVYKCLLDSGGTDPMINHKCIPSSVQAPSTIGA